MQHIREARHRYNSGLRAQVDSGANIIVSKYAWMLHNYYPLLTQSMNIINDRWLDAYGAVYLAVADKQV